MNKIFRNHNQEPKIDHKQTNDSIPKQSVSQSLHTKYAISYSFFTAKYVNQLIYSVGNSLCIRFDNLKAFEDDIQYLRRTYRHVGFNGKNQIQDRIKLVAKYYENETIGSNSPMMIEIKTNDIFLRRVKRLRRLKEPSQRPRSQISQSSFGTGSLSFSLDQDFLKDVDLPYSQLMNDQSSQFLKDIEYSDQEHDIYDSLLNDQNKIDTLSQLERLNLKENTIEHLVCDFREIDIVSVINFYKDIKKSKNGSVILSQIIEQQQKLSKKPSSQTQNSKTQKISKFSSQNALIKTNNNKQIQKQSLLSTYISIFGKKSKSKQSKTTLMRPRFSTTRSIAEECVNEYKKLWNTVENAQDDIEQRKIDLTNKRQKVREKAQRLLEGIKKLS